MCTLRALFLIQNNEIVISCRYHTVEKKLELLDPNYFPIGADGKMQILFQAEILKFQRINQMDFNSLNEVEILENNKAHLNKQHYDMFDEQKGNWFHFVFTLDDNIWPCLILQQQNKTLILIPFVKDLFQQNVNNENKNFVLSQSYCFQASLEFGQSFLQFLNNERVSKELTRYFRLFQIVCIIFNKYQISPQFFMNLYFL